MITATNKNITVKEISKLLCKEKGSFPSIPLPLTSKEISTNEATMIHLNQKEKCLDSLIQRFVHFMLKFQ